jgi:hypothetical protein
VADRVADAVDVPITVDGHADVHLSVSIGIAIAGSAAVTAEMLLRDADVAMYAARTARACATRSSTSGCGAAPPLARAASRSCAPVAGDELELHYQPLFDADAGRCARRVRSARALAAPAARPPQPGRVHRARRGLRPDRVAGQVGAAAGLRRRVVEGSDETRETLARLRDLGVGLARPMQLEALMKRYAARAPLPR